MNRAMQNRAAVFRAVAFMLIVLALAFVGPTTTEVTVHTAVVFIAQVVLISCSFHGAARRKGDADESDCCEEFDCVFHGDDCICLVIECCFGGALLLNP